MTTTNLTGTNMFPRTSHSTRLNPPVRIHTSIPGALDHFLKFWNQRFFNLRSYGEGGEVFFSVMVEREAEDQHLDISVPAEVCSFAGQLGDLHGG